MTPTLPEHSYPDGFEVRRVRRDGSLKWAGSYVFLGEAFRDELVAIEAIDDGLHHVHLGQMRLGALHERTRTVVLSRATLSGPRTPS